MKHRAHRAHEVGAKEDSSFVCSVCFVFQSFWIAPQRTAEICDAAGAGASVE